MVRSVYLFFGSERFLKDKILRDIRSKILTGAPGSLDFSLFYGDASAAKAIVDCARTAPFSSLKRLVVVRRFDRLRSEERASVREYAKRPSKSTCLILEADDPKCLDEFSSLTGSVEILRFDKISKEKKQRSLRALLASHGKVMDEDAEELLKGHVGDNIDCHAAELEKLITFTGSKKRIGLADVKELVPDELTGSAFDLADAIGAKRLDEALRIISELVLSGKRGYEIVGALSWHLRRLLRARELLEQGRRREHIASLLKIGRSFHNKFLAQVGNFKQSELDDKLKVLLDADIAMKTSRIDPGVSLEMAVIRLCL
ncbi:DNA polymerase III subunit delta [Candidatus Omnitrophota bacterium]